MPVREQPICSSGGTNERAEAHSCSVQVTVRPHHWTKLLRYIYISVSDSQSHTQHGAVLLKGTIFAHCEENASECEAGRNFNSNRLQILLH